MNISCTKDVAYVVEVEVVEESVTGLRGGDTPCALTDTPGESEIREI